MNDQYGRKIDYMRVSVTDRCNLRCFYCMPNGIQLVKHSDILPYEELLRICKVAIQLGIKKFKVTGGEPLVRKDCIKFIGKLKALPTVEQVTLTTNGTLLESYFDELCESGIDAINISIDTMDGELYNQITGSSKYDVSKIIDMIPILIERGIRVKINAVILAETLENAFALASIAEQYQVDIRFIELMPIGEGEKIKNVSAKELLRIIQNRYPDLHKVKEKRGNGPAHYYGAKSLLGCLGVIDAVSNSFCSKCNRVRLTSSGQLKPCLCYDDSVDLRKLIREGASDDMLLEVMENAIYQKPRQHKFIEKNVSENKLMSQIGG
ncbi:GTP 3',8-cyclase MoaA [Clostridium beijerinckii]|uniref:GTP 3',8-cyclase MoaA n=1 Tax=Clostridium beijerinckii TaxID=1520 RepID=UPI00098C3790|nr:GTP 3',8-cyclase MoaA [Clostridium beijerinckii]NRT80021.1 cyclic pyranopterin phosphate synthase [Clostridium beijerinckii]OOM48836.1 cyclic pyranopterin monophosphate synthase [Clostridium beijerinckii]